jgi:hypothetical protein
MSLFRSCVPEDWVPPFDLDSSMTAGAGTGLWRSCASNDRCAYMTDHSSMAGGVMARERLLRPGAIGRRTP